MEGEYEKEKKHHDKKTLLQFKDHEGHLGYYYSIRDYKRAKKLALPLHIIQKNALNIEKTLSWRGYTSLSVYCRPLVEKYINLPISSNIDKDDIESILYLLPIINLLAKRPLNKTIVIKQNATALRFQILFESFLGKEKPLVENYIFYLYSESASLDGIISSLRDIAFKNYLLAKHWKNDYIEKAFKFLSYSKNLAAIVGNVPGQTRSEEYLEKWVKINPNG